MTAAIRGALPVKSGRELEALRRIERRAGIAGQIDLIVSTSALEPGILGIFRPVLFLPAGIAGRLTDGQLDAIITHELCHVRRRDNLAAALHMFVESIFWFHPLVWWIGARLIDERESACDEEVLRLGSDPQAYAEGILKVCEFYLESPLFCAAGVTGSNLKRRIEAIMNHRAARDLDFSRRILLGAAGLLAVAGPIVIGLLSAREISAHAAETTGAPLQPFELASITPSRPGNKGSTVKFAPGRLTLANWTTKSLIVYAYNVSQHQISGGPSWIDSLRYDIDAKVDDSLAYKTGKLIETNVAGNFPPWLRHEQLMLMIQSLLADRFKLKLTHKIEQSPIYALAVSKNGSKLQEAKPGDTYADGIIGPDGLPVGPHRGTGQKGHLTVQALPMSTVVQLLSLQLGSGTDLVVDKTGLTREYDFTLEWTPSESQGAEPGPSIFTAIQEQLGLELKQETTPVEMLVIDHAEQVTSSESSRAQSQAQSIAGSASAFEAVTIKPNKTGEPMPGFKVSGRPMRAIAFKPERFMATNFTLHGLIQVSYGVQDTQIMGGPDWLDSEKYDVDAKVRSSVVDELGKFSEEKRSLEKQRMIQALLAERFKLTLHRETKNLPVYALVLAKNGRKLQEAKPGDTYVNGPKGPGGRPIGGGTLVEPESGKLVGQGVPVGELVALLSQKLGRTVLDETGLIGNYDFTLQWTAAQNQGASESSTSSILAAVQEQLGLRLESKESPAEVLVVDNAEKPSEN
jgi:uncharacterized protein (TIGR03435 family)